MKALKNEDEIQPDDPAIRSVYFQLKQEVDRLVDTEIERILIDPVLAGVVSKK